MTMIEISDSKVSKMSEYAEDALHAMGRLMSCISSLENGGYGERSEGRYGNRYGGGDIGYRHDDEEMRMGMRGRSMGYREMDDDDEDFGERRGRRRRDSMGRYR
jgi:hypothetical protein